MSGTVYPNPLVYTDADFRAQFTAFQDTECFPTSVLQMWFGVATDYISANNWGYLRDASRQQALYLMTAHLQYIQDAINADGDAPGIVTMAKVDKVEVQLKPPPSNTPWSYWLGQSPYGQALLALLSVTSVGGMWIGGRPELAAFRRVGGAHSWPSR